MRLLEIASSHVNLTFDQLEPYKRQILQFDQAGRPLYRGVRSYEKAMFVNASNFTRKSAYTNNSYTLMFDNLSSWKDIPKRSKSLPCSTSEEKATGYSRNGGLFYVIPLENQKIAIAPSSDFWVIFENLEFLRYGNTLNDFNSFIVTCVNLYNELENDDKEINIYADVLDVIDTAFEQCSMYLENKEEFENHIRTYYASKFGEEEPRHTTIRTTVLLVEDVINKLLVAERYVNMSADDFLEQQFNLSNTNITCDNYETLLPKLKNYKNKEVWMSGKILLINDFYFDEFVENLNKDTK